MLLQVHVSQRVGAAVGRWRGWHRGSWEGRPNLQVPHGVTVWHLVTLLPQVGRRGLRSQGAAGSGRLWGTLLPLQHMHDLWGPGRHVWASGHHASPSRHVWFPLGPPGHPGPGVCFRTWPGHVQGQHRCARSPGGSSGFEGTNPSPGGPDPAHQGMGNLPEVRQRLCPSPYLGFQSCRWPPGTPLNLRMSWVVPTNPHLTSHPSGDPGTSRPLCRKCLEGLGAGRGPEDPGRGLLAGGRVQGEWLEFACFSPGNRGGAACRCVSWRHAHQDPLGTRGAVQGWGSPTGLRPMVLDTRGGLRAPRRARPHACSTHSTQASMDSTRAACVPISLVLSHPPVVRPGLWGVDTARP